MSLRKRGGVYQIDIISEGKRIRQSAGTSEKALAQELHDKLKAASWRNAKLGELPRRTWNEAVVRWLKESTHKATLETDKGHLRWVDTHARGKYLDEMNRKWLDKLLEARLADGVSNATVNRMLEVVRAILRKCANEWEWISKCPSVRMLKEPSRRVRFLTQAEAGKLLSELPEHLAAIVGFSLQTGLRKSNVTGMQWTQVDLERRIAWIHPDQAKTRKAISVPLSGEAIAIIKRQVGKHPTHVFTYKGKLVRQVNTQAWKKALARAGIENFRFHDIRHTFSSWHIQQGTPLQALQELCGWESIEMVRRYAHFSAEHLAVYADRLVGATTPEEKQVGTNPSPENFDSSFPTSNLLN